MLRRIALYAALFLVACGGGSEESAPEAPGAGDAPDPLTAWIVAETGRLAEAAALGGDSRDRARRP